MRVLMCGGINCAEVVRNIARGFQRVGCEVVYQATRDGSKLGGGHEPLPGLEARMAELVIEFKPDLMFWALCKADCPPGLVRHLRALRPEMKTVFHSFDDPYQHDMHGDLVQGWMDGFEYAVTCCPTSVAWYGAHGVEAGCIYPPADHDLHGIAKVRPELDVDFAFVATNMYPREKYPQVLVNRSDLARRARAIGSLALYGSWDTPQGWGGADGVKELKDCFKGWLQFDAQGDVYASAKINISSHVRPDGYQYLNERVIYAMASGGFLLCDAVTGIEQLFTPGEHFDTWATLDEFEAKARKWLASSKERAAVAASGRRLVWEKYSNVRHSLNVFKLCGL